MSGGRPATVGIVPGGVDDPSSIVEPVEDAGRSVTVGSAVDVLDGDVEFVVACDEAGLLELVRATCRTPILPIDAGRGIQSVPANAARPAVTSVLDGAATTIEYPLLGVTVDDERLGRALFDVSLMTSEPAHISEYECVSNGSIVARFRADGVVVATPAGSHGYAKAAGGPVIEGGPAVVSVVPVSSFVTRDVNWVLDGTDVAVSVARDESAVSLFIDDREVGPVEPTQRLELGLTDAISTLIVPESDPPFGDCGG